MVASFPLAEPMRISFISKAGSTFNHCVTVFNNNDLTLRSCTSKALPTSSKVCHLAPTNSEDSQSFRLYLTVIVTKLYFNKNGDQFKVLNFLQWVIKCCKSNMIILDKLYGNQA